MGFPATTFSLPSDFSIAVATHLVSAASLTVAGTLSFAISMRGLRNAVGTARRFPFPEWKLGMELLVGAEPVLDIAVDLVVQLGLLSFSEPGEQEG